MSDGTGDLPDVEPDEDLAFWQAVEEEHSLVDLVNRVLDKGVVITGDVTISVAGVDLVYLGLSAVLTSISTLRAAAGERSPGSGDGDG